MSVHHRHLGLPLFPWARLLAVIGVAAAGLTAGEVALALMSSPRGGEQLWSTGMVGPTSPIYALQRFDEQVQLRLTWSADDQARLDLELANRRLLEAQDLSVHALSPAARAPASPYTAALMEPIRALGRAMSGQVDQARALADIDQAMQDFSYEEGQALEATARARAAGSPALAVEIVLPSNSARQIVLIDELSATVTPADGSALARDLAQARAEASRGLTVVGGAG
ncbi:MAG: DUF5667 domain-containing protein [Candidatus Dormibacteria bacterium]